MCAALPLVPILSFAVSAASTVLAFQGQNAAARAENARFMQAALSAGDSLADQQAQEGVRVQQVQAHGANQTLELMREAARARGQALASSAGSGMSKELLLKDIDRQREDYSDIIARNIRDEMQQSYWNKRGKVAEAQSRANAHRPTGGGGSLLGLGLGLAGAGLGAYSSFGQGSAPSVHHGAGARKAVSKPSVTKRRP